MGVAFVNYKHTHDGGTLCPFVSMATGQRSTCMEDQCEFWTRSPNDDYSTCAINLLARQLDSICYRVTRDG